MKQILFVIFLICFPYNNSFAADTLKISNVTTINSDTLNSELSNSNVENQIPKDTITIKKKFTEVYGYKNGQLLSYSDYKVLFANSPDALNHIKSANILHKTGNFFGYVGGFMFGFIGVLGLKDIDNVDYTWGIALGTSAAVVGIGLLIYSAGNHYQIKALNIYNGSTTNLKDNKKVGYLKVGFTTSGIGLAYTF